MILNEPVSSSKWRSSKLALMDYGTQNAALCIGLSEPIPRLNLGLQPKVDIAQNEPVSKFKMAVH